MSLTHILILALIILVVSRPKRLTELGRGIGEGLRQFKRSAKGEQDIDVTDSVKRLDDE
jgi:TatA/E family protein of Tat protein translocase